MDVSVIIPVYRDSHRLFQCLSALQYQTISPQPYEVLVIINEDAPLPFDVSDIDTRFKCYNEATKGSYAARNRGIIHSSSQILAFTDSDCVPDRAWLENGVRSLQTQEADIIGGRISFMPPRTGKLNVYEICETHLFYMTNHKQTIERHNFAVTANMFCRKSMFEAFGLFDSTLKSSGDREWVLRATNGGAKLRYSHDCQVLHPRRSHFPELARKIRRLKGGMVQVAKKHPTSQQLYFCLRYTPLDFRMYQIPFAVAPVSISMRLRMALLLIILSLIGANETLLVAAGAPAYRGR